MTFLGSIFLHQTPSTLCSESIIVFLLLLFPVPSPLHTTFDCVAVTHYKIVAGSNHE